MPRCRTFDVVEPASHVLIKCIALAGCLLATTGVQAQDAISFAKDIRLIFEASCWKCHSATVQHSKLNLRTRESAIAGRVHGPAISPGNPGASRLYRMVAGAEKPSMPLDGKLTAAQVRAIKLWIEQGAQWDSAAATAVPSSVSELEQGTVSPEARKFRAFQKPVRTSIPRTGNQRMDRHLISWTD